MQDGRSTLCRLSVISCTTESGSEDGSRKSRPRGYSGKKIIFSLGELFLFWRHPTPPKTVASCSTQEANDICIQEHTKRFRTRIFMMVTVPIASSRNPLSQIHSWTPSCWAASRRDPPYQPRAGAGTHLSGLSARQPS